MEKNRNRRDFFSFTLCDFDAATVNIHTSEWLELELGFKHAGISSDISTAESSIGPCFYVSKLSL